MVEPHEIEWTEERIAALWNYYASNPIFANQYFSFHSGEALLRHVLRRVRLRTGLSLLDFGCGSGAMYDHLVNIAPGVSYFGLDFSPDSVTRLNQRLTGQQAFHGAVAVHGLPSEYPSESMDMALAIEVVEHLSPSQLEGTLAELHRVLKPEGTLVISTPNDEDLQAQKTLCPECGAVFHRWQHMVRWNRDSLDVRLTAAGFRTLHMEDISLDPDKRTALRLLRRAYRALFWAGKGANLVYIGSRLG